MIIHKTLTVARPPDVAFKIFVDELAQWWPSHSHSFVGGDAKPTIEPRVGGRFFERNSEGSEYTIGEVLAYEPGARVSFTWNHGKGKGTTEIDVRFSADGAGTRLDLTHSGWERLRDPKEAAGYDTGWDTVLGYYIALAGAEK